MSAAFLADQQDLTALVDSSKRINVRGTSTAGQLIAGDYQQGEPPVGFTVRLNKQTGSFQSDADSLPDVFLRILPQVSSSS